MPQGMKQAVGTGHSDWNALHEGYPPLAILVALQLNSTRLTEIIQTSPWFRVKARFHADSSSRASTIQARIQSDAC